MPLKGTNKHEKQSEAGQSYELTASGFVVPRKLLKSSNP